MRQGDIIAATGADRQPDRPLAAAALVEDHHDRSISASVVVRP